MKQTGFEERELVAYLPALRAFSRRFVRSDFDAGDLVQETVSRALASRHLFQEGTPFEVLAFHNHA
jgi:RNA polymerase sigma-70 factor, ECF subfamily